MKISVVSFTDQGGRLACRLKDIFGTDVTVSNRHSREEKENLYVWTGKQFQEKNAVVFIGATGIAVRAIAPFVKDKFTDSPVLVMDERGQYVIPLLSGHLGGANELAEEIAVKTGALPVITTATDINRKFSVDLFAKKQYLTILNREGIAVVSAKILDGKKATIAVENGTSDLLEISKELEIPKELEVVPFIKGAQTDIVISNKKEKNPEAVLQLKPKEYILGIGCRKGKRFEDIRDFIKKQLEALQITEQDIRAIASIDVKKEEEGIVKWKNYFRVPFWTFTSKELMRTEGDFHGSVFVEKQVGVDNVCERAALAACGGEGKLVLEKQAENGMTLAVARKSWKYICEEEKQHE